MTRIILFFLVLLLSFSLSAQVVKLSVNAKPLNQVLIGLRDNYGIRFSFDDKELSQYTVSVHREFSTPQKALDFLLRPFAYNYMLNQGVYVIYHQPPVLLASLGAVPKRDFQLSGVVSDRQSGEALPYTFLVVNKNTILCDEKGRFSYSSKSDSVFRLTFRHLGYYVKDTVVSAGVLHRFAMQTASLAMHEVVVSSTLEKSMTLSDFPGSVRANNLVAKNLPGNEGGSVFSLLRLLPGVYSAGEQSRDLIIWGGYEGQSAVTLDGFTLFGLKNFNDNISVVNPYIVKDVKVSKGGFGSRLDDRVGGIVNVTGVDGNVIKPEVKANVSNLTLNTFASVPVTRKSAVVLAYRQTFYNLYEDQSKTQMTPKYNSYNDNDEDDVPIDAFSIKPTYRFFDSNLKFSGKTDGGNSYLVSLYGGKDRFSYSVSNKSLRNPLTTVATQQQTQLGSAVEFNKQWENGNRSTFRFTYSKLNSVSDDASRDEESRGQIRETKDVNHMREAKLVFENQITSNSIHSAIFGAGVVKYLADFEELTTPEKTNLQFFPINNNATVFDAFVSDRMTLFPKFVFTSGLRVNWSRFSSTPFWQPRFSAEWHPSDAVRFAGSVGLYRQFNAKVLLLEQYVARASNPRNASEEDEEYHDEAPLPPDKSEQVWTVADGYKVPVVKSVHRILGAYYQSGGFSASAEGFLKTTGGLSRWIRTIGAVKFDRDSVVFGTSDAYGVDFMVRQQYQKHYAWLSYSYGQTKEHFTNQIGTQYAPQDQRHELKGAVLLDFSPFSFSTNYVYGSGYPTYRGLKLIANAAREPYHRLDASVTYHFTSHKIRMKGGLTVLNLLNNRNLTFSNLVSASSTNNDVFAVYSQAIPFTPMIFFEFSY